MGSSHSHSRSFEPLGASREEDLFTSIFTPLLSSTLLLPSSFAGYTTAYPLLWNALKLFVFTMVFETARRWFNDFVKAIKSGLALTVHIPQDHPAYQWIHQWLAASTTHELDTVKVPIWLDLLETILPTGRVPPRTVVMVTHNHWRPTQDGEDNPSDPLLENPTLWTYPSTSLRRTLLYQGHLMCLEDTLHQGMLSLPDDEGSRRYRSEDSTICINRKEGRPWESIILPEGIKEMLLQDAQDFLDNLTYYKARGMPYRRGYLLYGMPGTGKSSVISAIASKLRLDIYVINLSGQQSDEPLSELFSECPARSIVLIEDIDCAFGEDESDPYYYMRHRHKSRHKHMRSARSRMSMSGVLNAIDGVGSSEGRLLFCTTNHIKKIDPALIRPGRCDVKVEFKGVTRFQARQLFLFVHKPREEDSANATHTSLPTSSSVSTLSSASSEGDLKSLTVNDEKRKLSSGDKTYEQLNGVSLNRLEELAERFSEEIPEERISAAPVKGYLMRYKGRPEEATSCVSRWVDGELNRERVREREEAESSLDSSEEEEGDEEEERKGKQAKNQNGKEKKESGDENERAGFKEQAQANGTHGSDEDGKGKE